MAELFKCGVQWHYDFSMMEEQSKVRLLKMMIWHEVALGIRFGVGHCKLDF